MRFVFLIPDFETKLRWDILNEFARFMRSQSIKDWVRLKFMQTDVVYGGTLNIMRHCWVARNCGASAVLATMSGRDSYGALGAYTLPFIRWADRQANDICIIPDYVTELMNDVKGPAIAYLQVPIHSHNNFDYSSERFSLWTDSPFMLEICKNIFPNKEIEIVPNVVDSNVFPFIRQSEREPGLIFAFPRKGPDFISETERIYKELGGSFWHFQLIDGMPFHELAMQFRRPQAFLASAPIEGCALPPQESMAAGVVVVGRTASGANFYMRHRETAMEAETPQEAARCLIELESMDLRSSISTNAHSHISKYFPERMPSDFWRKTIEHYASKI